ncbi:histidine phosphatase family protein [Bacillus safensis]
MSAHTIIIVRHGKATGNNPDAPLTAMGKQQAQQVAFFLQ